MTRWTARVWADRDHYELVRARDDGSAPVPEFPREPREFTVDLVGEQVTIGRRPVADEAAEGSAGGTRQSPRTVTDPASGTPGIDLTGPPRDPGVSHRHAVLLAVGDDRWVVLDAGSTNGTTVNYGGEALAPDTPVPLGSGDTIHVGAWTTITVRRRDDPES